MNAEEHVLTPEEVAERLKIKPATVRLWLRSGQLRGFRAGPKLWRTTEEALAEMLKREDKDN